MSHNWNEFEFGSDMPHKPRCMQPRTHYRCLVRAINQAGLVSHAASSNGFTIDATPPHGGYVLDGAISGHTILLSQSETSYSARWGGFTESEYGDLVAYEAGVGRCADDPESVALYPMGVRTEHTYAPAHARVALQTSPAPTDGPWVAPSPIDATCSRVRRALLRHAVRRFEFVQDGAGVCTDAGTVPSVSARGDALSPCRLEHFVSYCVVVRAQNKHGGWSARKRSSGVRVCLEPPQHGTVSDGIDMDEPDGERDFAQRPEDVVTRWGGFDDRCAMGIVFWSVQLQRRVQQRPGQLYRDATWAPTASHAKFGNPANATYLDIAPPIAWSPEPFKTGAGLFGAQYSFASSLTSGIQLETGSEYRSRVCATSVLNLSICSYSDGFMYDPTPPTPGQLCLVHPNGERTNCSCVIDGDHACPEHLMVADASTSAPATKVCWMGITDVESRIRRFEWGVSTVEIDQRHVVTDVHPWTNIGHRRCLLVKEAAASIGRRTSSLEVPYMLHVRGINHAGGHVVLSRAIVFDGTPPVLRSVANGDPSSGSLYVRGTTRNHFDGMSVSVPAPSVELCWQPSTAEDAESALSAIRITVQSSTDVVLDTWDTEALSPPPMAFYFPAGGLERSLVQLEPLSMPRPTVRVVPTVDRHRAHAADTPNVRCVALNVTLHGLHTATLHVRNFAGAEAVTQIRFRCDPTPVRNGVFSLSDPAGQPLRFLAATSYSNLIEQSVQLSFHGYSGPVAAHLVSLQAWLCPEGYLHAMPVRGMPVRGTLEELERSSWPSPDSPDAPDDYPARHPLRCPGSELVSVSVAETFMKHVPTVRLPWTASMVCGVTYEVRTIATTYAGLTAQPLSQNLTTECSAPIGGVVSFTTGCSSSSSSFAPTAETVERADWIHPEPLNLACSDSRRCPTSPGGPHACIIASQAVWASLDHFYDFESNVHTYALARQLESEPSVVDVQRLTTGVSLAADVGTIEDPGGIDHNGVGIGSAAVIGLRRLVRLDTSVVTAPQFSNISVSACNRVGMCGPPVAGYLMVCAAPGTLTGGTVRAHHDECCPGFFTSNTSFSGAWTGFYDECASNERPMAYSVCIGTTPFGCQYLAMTPVAAATHVGPGVQPPIGRFGWGSAHAALQFQWNHTELDLRCTHTYYMTVRATNCAGDTTTVPADGIKLCCYPPQAGQLQVVDARSKPVSRAGSGAALRVEWDGFTDECAGVRSYRLVLIREEDQRGHRRIMTREMEHVEERAGPFSVDLNAPGTALAQGAYRCELTATSHAALSTTISTPVFVVDLSPPDDVGGPPRLRWKMSPTGWLAARGPDVCLPSSTAEIEFSWSIIDTLSHLAQNSYAVIDANQVGGDGTAGLAPTAETAQMLPWRPIGLQPLVRVPTSTLPSAGAARFAVRACNRVGLCTYSHWSRAVRYSAAEPSGGTAKIQTSAEVTGDFVTDPGSLVVESSNFSVFGCPVVCGTPSQTCFYDPTCSHSPPRRGGEGCNAGGFGRHCRFCGFETYERCPAGHGEPIWSGADGPKQLSTMTGVVHHERHALLGLEVCIGTTALGCQVRRFADAGGISLPSSLLSTDQVTTGVTGLALQCGGAYYATIRATNCAGLARTVASQPVTMCCSGPKAGRVRLVNAAGERYSAWSDGMPVWIVWDGFADRCSGVREYALELTVSGSVSPIGQYVQVAVPAPTRGDSGPQPTAETREMEIPSGLLAAQSQGELVSVSVVATSHAALRSVAAVSDAVIIDRTPPMAGAIELAWAESALTVEFRSLAPMVDCIPPTVASLQVSWRGFEDLETNVSMHSIRLESTDGAASESEMGAARSLVLDAAELRSRSRIYGVTVSACNAVNLCNSSQYERTIHLLASPPKAGSVALQQVASAVGMPTTGYANQQSPTLNGRWAGFTSGSPGALVFEVCVGSTPGGCQAVGPLRLPLNWSTAEAAVLAAPASGNSSSVGSGNSTAAVSGNATQWSGSWTSDGSVPLRCEHEAYLSVRAIDCGGLATSAISSGLRVCCRPPQLRKLAVIQGDDDGSNTAPVEYATNASQLRLAWAELAEACSGIRSVTAAIVPDLNQSDVLFTWSQYATGDATWTAAQAEVMRRVPVDALDILEHGRSYRVSLRVTSHAGLTSTITSPRFRFDLTPPDKGELRVGRCYMPGPSAPIAIGWDGFEDLESGISSIEMALGTVPNGQDILPARRVGQEPTGQARLQDVVSLQPGSMVYVTVRATNSVGLMIEVSMPPGQGIRVLDPATAPTVCVSSA